MNPQPRAPTHTATASRFLPGHQGRGHVANRSGWSRPLDTQADLWIREAYREQAAECLGLGMLGRRHGPFD